MRTKKGVITSAKMQNTAVVTVHTYRKHPLYEKRYRISKKFFADNPENKYKEGDVVTIQETRPMSKRKRWKVIELHEQESAS